MARFDNPDQGTYAIFDNPSAFSGNLPVVTGVTPPNPENANVADVIIDGSNFGAVKGAGFVTYGEFIDLPVVNWSDSQIRVRWPNLVVENGTMDFAVNHPLSVTNSSLNKSNDVQTQTAAVNDNSFRYFTPIAKDPSRAAEEGAWDDSTLVLGTDRIYRELIPPEGVPPSPYDWDDLTLEPEGFYGGVPEGGQVVFNIWDVGLGQWSNQAVHTFSLQTNRDVTCNPASMALIGSPATLAFTRQVDAASAAMAMTGSPAAVARSRDVAAASASMAMTGQTASISRGGDRDIAADTAIMSIVGETATISRSRNVTCTPASMALVGEQATVTRPLNRDVNCSPAAMSLTGSPADVTRGTGVPDASEHHGVYNKPLRSGVYGR